MLPVVAPANVGLVHLNGSRERVVALLVEKGTDAVGHAPRRFVGHAKLALKNCRIKTIPEERLREKDPGLVSFFNINTPQDLARAEQMLSAGKTTEAAWTSPP